MRAAPRGNTYSVGHGRPEEYDLDKEADDLLEWSLKDDATSLYKFTDSKTYLACELSYFAKRSERFSKCLLKAKERIAIRRETHLNKDLLHQAAWSRAAHLYDIMLDESEEAKKDKQAERQKNIEGSKQTTYNIVVPHDLASGANLPAPQIPNPDNNSPQ